MKERKFILGGGIRALILSLLFVLTTVTSLAYTEGQTVKYNSTVSDTDAIVFIIDGIRGFCCEVGVEQASSGTGTIDSVSSSNTLAKVLYYISKNGLDKRDGRDNTSGLPWELVCQGMVQYAVQGDTAVTLWQTSTNGNWPDVTINAIKGYVEEAKKETPAKGFKAFTVDAGKHQNFAAFYIEEPGTLKLKKVSSLTSITGR